MPLNGTTNKCRVFISYARADGADFAAKLRCPLQGEKIPLWQDRVSMEGGRDWWRQITDALDQVEFMVLVMTPKALASPIIRREWRYARQRGVCVYPVQGNPSPNFADAPRWMREVHWYDLESEWEKFRNDLMTRCEQPRGPFMAGDLPPEFVAEVSSCFGRWSAAPLIGLLIQGQDHKVRKVLPAWATGWGTSTRPHGHTAWDRHNIYVTIRRMDWSIEYYDQALEDKILALPNGLLARYIHLADLMLEFGSNLGSPHTKALGNGLFELRLKSKEGIARVFYCTKIGKQIIMLHVFIKKSQKIPQKEMRIATKRMNEVLENES